MAGLDVVVEVVSKSYRDQRRHRRKVAGTPQGKKEHIKREKKRRRQTRIERRAAAHV